MKDAKAPETGLAESGEGPNAAPRSTRRVFLRKGTAAAALTTLAAQPVWGKCTVSGAMSGGSRHEDDDPCKIPNVVGRSPGFWTEAMYVGNALRSAFPNVPNGHITRLRCFIDQEKVNNNFTYKLSPDEQITISVAAALSDPGGLAFNLAAIWLNAFFGFFPDAIVPDVVTPQDWVEHFNGLWVVAGDSGIDPFEVIFSDDDPSTSWNYLPPGYQCPS